MSVCTKRRQLTVLVADACRHPCSGRSSRTPRRSLCSAWRSSRGSSPHAFNCWTARQPRRTKRRTSARAADRLVVQPRACGVCISDGRHYVSVGGCVRTTANHFPGTCWCWCPLLSCRCSLRCVAVFVKHQWCTQRMSTVERRQDCTRNGSDTMATPHTLSCIASWFTVTRSPE
jgi:hypothetical protein